MKWSGHSLDGKITSFSVIASGRGIVGNQEQDASGRGIIGNQEQDAAVSLLKQIESTHCWGGSALLLCSPVPTPPCIGLTALILSKKWI